MAASTDVANLGPNDLERWAADDPSDFDAGSCIERLAAATAAGGPRARPPRARSSPSPAASTRASSPGSACAPLGPERVLCLRLPERDVGDASSDLGLELAESARRAHGGGADHRRARGRSAATAAATRRSAGCSRSTSRAGGTSSFARRRPAGSIVFSLVVERPDGTEEPRRMPSDAYRELLAATNMKQRVRKLLEYTLGRPARLRRHRHAEPARVRPGLLRQGRRRPRRRQADRAASTRARSTRSRAQLGLPEAIATAPADDRDLQPPADPGGVLLRPPVRAHGPAGVGHDERRRARRARRAGRARRPTRSRPPTREIERRRRRDRLPARARGHRRPGTS